MIQITIPGIPTDAQTSILIPKKKKKNPRLNFLKGTVLGDKEQGVGIRDKGQGSKDKE